MMKKIIYLIIQMKKLIFYQIIMNNNTNEKINILSNNKYFIFNKNNDTNEKINFVLTKNKIK
jgi:hypothetical protein